MSDDRQLLFETYKLHAELAEQVAAAREGLNKLYSSMVAGIIAASVLLHRFVPVDEKLNLELMLPVVGFVVSLSWMLALFSVTGKLYAKRKILLKLEKNLPINFFEQENFVFKASGFYRRIMTALFMPIAFLVISISWFLILAV